MTSVNLEAEKTEIERLMQAWVKADNDKNVEKMMSFLDSDVIAHVAFSPEIRGIEANRRMAEEYMTETGFWTFETKKIEVSSDADMAYLTGFYHFTVKDWKSESYYSKSQKEMDEIIDDGKMLVVWKNTDDGWKIVAYAGTSDIPSE
jgi:ketosteroid isomerase-like protein